MSYDAEFWRVFVIFCAFRRGHPRTLKLQELVCSQDNCRIRNDDPRLQTLDLRYYR